MKRWIGIILGITLFFAMHPIVQVYAAPGLSAQAAVLMEYRTYDVLFARNAYEKRSMASTTKIMSALLTLESGDLDTPFTVDSDAIHVEGSSMGLQEGDIVTKRALCYGMLLPSGNDAANAAAVAVAGSIPEFAERMNARAAAIGMTRSCFVTPSGLEGEGHGASAYDMALLTREALENPDFRAICSQKSARLEFGNPPYARTLYNSNKLLSMYDGVIGVKTGFTDEAGRCLVSACERDGVTLICVTLNAPDDWNDHIKLYELGFSKMHVENLEVPDALSMPVAGGIANAVRLVPADAFTAGCGNGGLPQMETVFRHDPFAYAPVHRGDVLGTLEYYCNDRKIAETALLADEDIPVIPHEPGNWEHVRTWFTGLLSRT